MICQDIASKHGSGHELRIVTHRFHRSRMWQNLLFKEIKTSCFAHVIDACKLSLHLVGSERYGSERYGWIDLLNL